MEYQEYRPAHIHRKINKKDICKFCNEYITDISFGGKHITLTLSDYINLKLRKQTKKYYERWMKQFEKHKYKEKSVEEISTTKNKSHFHIAGCWRQPIE